MVESFKAPGPHIRYLSLDYLTTGSGGWG